MTPAYPAYRTVDGMDLLVDRIDTALYPQPRTEADWAGDREVARRLDKVGGVPKYSLVLVLPENHVISPDRLAEALRSRGGHHTDIVVACAGQPTNLAALQRCVHEAEFVLAPAGTTVEDLRALAIRHTTGDIVTMLNGAVLPTYGSKTRERVD